MMNDSARTVSRVLVLAAAVATLGAAGRAGAAEMYLRYTSSLSHGAALYLRLDRESPAGNSRLLGYLSLDALARKPPAKERWLRPGQATPWISLPAPRPGQTQRLSLTCYCGPAPAASFSVLLDVAPEPNPRAIVPQDNAGHSVALASDGSTFAFAIAADRNGRLRLELPPLAVNRWLAEPDVPPVPPGPAGPRFELTEELVTRKRLLLGACGSAIDIHRDGGPLRDQMQQLVDFYRTFHLNFIYNFYPHDAYPWQGDWPATCRKIRAWQAVLNEAGIAASQPILGRWLGEEGYRHPEKRAMLENGRRGGGALCPRQSDLQRQVAAKLLENVPLDGFHIEEPATPMCYCPRCQAEFRRYVAQQRSQYPEQFFFTEPLATLRAPTEAERFTRRDLWWHWCWFSLRSYRDYYGSLFGAARSAGKQTWQREPMTMTSIGYSGVVLPMAGARHTDFLADPRVSGMLNALYWHCGEKVTVDSFKDYHLQTAWCKGQSPDKPVWFYIVTKSSKCRIEPWWFEAEVYDSLLAGLDGFILWPALAERDAEVFPGIRRALGFAAGHMDCLAGVESCAQAAIAYNYDQTSYELFGTRYQDNQAQQHFTEHFRAMFHVLSDLHVPADYIVALTPENLKRYRLLVLDELRCMTDQEAAAVRDWVAGGGSLLAMGDVSGCDLYERPRAAYPLADVLGVGGKSRRIASPGGLQILRQPALGKDFAAGGFDYGADLFMYWHFQYKHFDNGYGIEPRPGARTLARWSGGSPAMVANEFGKGRCVYSGAFLQFCPPPQRDQLAGKLVRWLLRDDVPVTCDRLPPEGDVNVLKKGDRLFVHLLNLKRWRLAGDRHRESELSQWTIERPEPLEELTVTVSLPAGRAPTRATILSPDAPKPREIDLRVREGKATFVVPRLDLYSVVVLEKKR
jgi:hypothetical protein